jgi:signal transduction histidine kinase
MNGIIGSISLLADSGVTEEQHEHVETIRSCGEALLSLVNDILDVAKIEAGKLTLKQTPFRPDKVVKEALAVVAPAAAARGLELRQRLAEDLPQVVAGDPQRLRQVLLNLLSNAVKFTERGYLAVDASLAGSSADLAEVRFTVGIPASESRRRCKRRSFNLSHRPTVRPRGAMAGRGWGFRSAAS